MSSSLLVCQKEKEREEKKSKIFQQDSQKFSPAAEKRRLHLKNDACFEVKNLPPSSTCVMTICWLLHRKAIIEIIVVSLQAGLLLSDDFGVACSPVVFPTLIKNVDKTERLSDNAPKKLVL